MSILNKKTAAPEDYTSADHASNSESATALVTGASRGIGRAIAEKLAREGWNLILTCSKTLPELRNFALELEEKYQIEARSMLCDMGNPDDVRELFRNIHSLDLLVNNAGISYVGLLQDMTDKDWDRLIATNLSSVFYTCREAIPLFLAKNLSISNNASHLNSNVSSSSEGPLTSNDSPIGFSKENVPAIAAAKEDFDTPDLKIGVSVSAEAISQAIAPGRIINISSVWGNVGASCEAAYSATKGGINALTKALAKELAPSGIPVNAIACGCVNTVMNDNLDPEEKAQLAAEIPFGRFAEPSEIADAVWQLVSAPAYLTGQIITVDGGWI